MTIAAIFVSYFLLFTPFWAVSILMLFSLTLYRLLVQKAPVYLAFRTIFLVYVLILLAIATTPTYLYDEINKIITSFGYPSGVTLFFLPNIYSTNFLSCFQTELRGLIIATINLFLLTTLVYVVFPEVGIARITLLVANKVKNFCSTNLRVVARRLFIFSLIVLSICLISSTLIKIISGTLPIFLIAMLKVFYHLRCTTIVIPYVVLPMLIIKPNLAQSFHQFLENHLVSCKTLRLRCYHLTVFFVISWLFFLNFTMKPVNDPNLYMCDDRLYYSIWIRMKEGIGLYEAWKIVWPTVAESQIHWSILFYLWALCKTVFCIKIEYFLISSCSVIAAFYIARKISNNSFVGVLSALYILSFYTRGFFWFMMEHWSVAPLLLGLLFLVYRYYFLSTLFFTLAFFFKETSITPLFMAILIYSLPSVKAIADGVWSKEIFGKISYLIGFLFILVFMFIHSTTYVGYTQLFFKRFAPHYFIHQISWFMYPIGVINFSLAIVGSFLVREENNLKLLLISAIIFTHLLFSLYNPASEAAARSCVAAIAIEHVVAPLGLEVIVKNLG